MSLSRSWTAGSEMLWMAFPEQILLVLIAMVGPGQRGKCAGVDVVVPLA